MFSGVIRDLGTIRRVILKNEGAELTVHGGESLKGFEDGESIAVNGVCLTVRDSTETTFTVDLSTETLSRTSFNNIGFKGCFFCQIEFIFVYVKIITNKVR